MSHAFTTSAAPFSGWWQVNGQRVHEQGWDRWVPWWTAVAFGWPQWVLSQKS